MIKGFWKFINAKKLALLEIMLAGILAGFLIRAYDWLVGWP